MIVAITNPASAGFPYDEINDVIWGIDETLHLLLGSLGHGGCHPDYWVDPVRITSVTLSLVSGTGGPHGFDPGDRVRADATVQNKVDPLCAALQQRETSAVRARFDYLADVAGEVPATTVCDLQPGDSCTYAFAFTVASAPADAQELRVRAVQQPGASAVELDRVEVVVPIS